MDTPGRAWYALAGAAAALVPSLAMWGFTVDDALISIRYAHHLVTGAGYAFNAHAAATDGVTPLPWPFLLAPLATTSDLVTVLVRAKVFGVLAWTGAGAVLGASVAKAAGPAKHAPRVLSLVVVALAFPIGAWAASGMETGLALALATLAACTFERPPRAALLAGLAAALRPELAPWALTLAVGATIAAHPRSRPDADDADADAPRRSTEGASRAPEAAGTGDPRAATARAWLLPAALAVAPFAVCAVARGIVFGSIVPLAVIAKPSDASHGLVYAVAAVVVGLAPLLLVAPFALRRASARAKTLVVALAVHTIVMVAVGGDWMPYARLIVPILPGLVLAAVDLAAVAHRAATYARAVLAVALGLYLAAGAAPAGRHVHPDRAALVAAARPVLANAKVVAALDIGWVGAATDARIVDLAGLTDPAIAILPGGHTTKAVDVAMLLDREVDTVVIYTPPRGVERRLLATPLFEERFAPTATLPLAATTYAVFTRR